MLITFFICLVIWSRRRVWVKRVPLWSVSVSLIRGVNLQVKILCWIKLFSFTAFVPWTLGTKPCKILHVTTRPSHGALIHSLQSNICPVYGRENHLVDDQGKHWNLLLDVVWIHGSFEKSKESLSYNTGGEMSARELCPSTRESSAESWQTCDRLEFQATICLFTRGYTIRGGKSNRRWSVEASRKEAAREKWMIWTCNYQRKAS